VSLARRLDPDIVLLHGTWGEHLDNVAETVLALKKQTTARVVVLGSVPAWRRGLPSEVLQYFMLHRRLIPLRSTNATPCDGLDAVMRARLEPLGAEFISASDVFCNTDGCLTRIGDTAGDISVSDQVHLTERASVFLVQSVIAEVLGQTPRSPKESQYIAGPRLWRVPSGAAGDLAGIDVENLARRADVGEGLGVGAGHPDLRAELRQLGEQRRAPIGIEMRHHLVEQQ
jgi:hypothetical protein